MSYEVAIGELGEGGQLSGVLDADGTAGKAPAPVVADCGGGVHAGFGAEGEDVLQGEDAGVGDRFGGGADERPDDGLITAWCRCRCWTAARSRAFAPVAHQPAVVSLSWVPV